MLQYGRVQLQSNSLWFILYVTELSIPKWMHTLWHTVAIIRARRELLAPEQLIDNETNTKTKELLKDVRNQSIKMASRHLEQTFNLHQVIHKLYDNLYTIDVSLLRTLYLLFTYWSVSCPPTVPTSKACLKQIF